MQKSIIYLTDRIIKWLPSALAIAAELSLGSCSQEYQGEGPSGVITFDAYLRGNSTTRASVIDVEKLKLTGYGVFAFDTGQQGFNPEAAGGHVPNFMYNQLVEWLSSADSPANGTWTYSPETSWTGNNISFFAYAPYAGSFGETFGITSLSGKKETGDPKLSFKMSADLLRQTDLLYADAANTIDLMSGTVQFNFNHALSRISFLQPKTEGLDPNTTITITGLTLQSPQFAISGTLNLRTGVWGDLVTNQSNASEEISYHLDANGFMPGSGDNSSTSHNNFLMIIPSGPTDCMITVTYNITTHDDLLTDGYIKTVNRCSANIPLNLKSGKAYELQLSISPKSISLSAEVADWNEDENSNWGSEIEG